MTDRNRRWCQAQFTHATVGEKLSSSGQKAISVERSPLAAPGARGPARRLTAVEIGSYPVSRMRYAEEDLGGVFGASR